MREGIGHCKEGWKVLNGDRVVIRCTCKIENEVQ